MVVKPLHNIDCLVDECRYLGICLVVICKHEWNLRNGQHSHETYGDSNLDPNLMTPAICYQCMRFLFSKSPSHIPTIPCCIKHQLVPVPVLQGHPILLSSYPTDLIQFCRELTYHTHW